MAEQYDPLGRLADHAALPYNHPRIDQKVMTAYWQRFYADEARAIGADLATEHERAVGAVAECEAALKAATDACRRFWSADSWETELRKQDAAIRRENLRHRLVRLTGRRDALAAEAARRGGE